MANIDTVFLDAAGTLFTVSEPVSTTYAELAGPFGGTLDREALDAGFREVFPAMPPLAFPGTSGDELDAAERQWWRTLVSRVIARAGRIEDFDGYFDRLYAYYAGAQAWRVYDEVDEVITTLRRRGCRLAVVSNFDSRLLALLDEMELSDRFDAVIHSGGAGAAKPDRAIFDHALALLGATPERTLHVGDSTGADYEGAIAAGLHGLLVTRHGPADAAHRIRDLRGMLGFVD